MVSSTGEGLPIGHSIGGGGGGGTWAIDAIPNGQTI